MSQDPTAAAANRSFFDANALYAAQVAELATYRNIRGAVNRALPGIRRLLDIGNGGVFDYDTRLVPEIVAVDLFNPGRTVPANVTTLTGDALSLPLPDGMFDGVLMVSVLHHLIGRDTAATAANMRQAIGEAARMLTPGGRFVLMESCIPRVLFPVERMLFAPLKAVAAAGLMEHPATLQFPACTIERFLQEHFAAVTAEKIPAGCWIIQFGHRWPTVLTPARPYLFVAS